MADTSTNPQQSTEPTASQQAVVTPVQVNSSAVTAGSVIGNAGQTAGAAMDGAKQAADKAQQAVAQAGVQAQQVASQATQAAAQVSAQAQQLAGQAGQTAQAAQTLAKDLFMPKADQPKVIMEDKIVAFFAYMPLVCFLCLLLKPKSDYVALHGRQGMVLTGVFFVSILIIIIPFLGPMLSSLIILAWLVISIYSAYQALIGNWWKIPVIGDLAVQIPASMFATAAHEALTGQVSDQATTVAQPPQEQVQAQPEPPTQQPPTA